MLLMRTQLLNIPYANYIDFNWILTLTCTYIKWPYMKYIVILSKTYETHMKSIYEYIKNIYEIRNWNNFIYIYIHMFPPGGMTCPTQSKHSHLQESAKNTSLLSLFDPLTLALSILILFLKKKKKKTCLF